MCMRNACYVMCDVWCDGDGDSELDWKRAV